MKLIRYNDTENYDVDLTHDWFLCESGDHIFLSHLGFDQEDGYFVKDEHGEQYFMYDPNQSCEVYLVLTNKQVDRIEEDRPSMLTEGRDDVMDTIDPNWADDESDPGEGGPPYDAATQTGMYDHD